MRPSRERGQPGQAYDDLDIPPAQLRTAPARPSQAHGEGLRHGVPEPQAGRQAGGARCLRRAGPVARAAAAPTLPARGGKPGRSRAEGCTEVLSAMTPPAQACPPPPAGRGPRRPEGQHRAHSPPRLSAAWPPRWRREKGGGDPAPEAAGVPHSGEGTGGGPGSWPGRLPAYPRVLTPAPSLTEPTGPGSPLQRLLNSHRALGLRQAWPWI